MARCQRNDHCAIGKETWIGYGVATNATSLPVPERDSRRLVTEC